MTSVHSENERPSSRVQALAAAYRTGRLVVSADAEDLARARRLGGVAIDVRGAAQAFLRAEPDVAGAATLEPVAA